MIFASQPWTLQYYTMLNVMCVNSVCFATDKCETLINFSNFCSVIVLPTIVYWCINAHDSEFMNISVLIESLTELLKHIFKEHIINI